MPSNPLYVFGIVIAVAGLLVVVAVVLGKYRHARRAAAMRAWAERHGYQYTEEANLMIGELPIFRDGAQAFYHNVIQGQFRGRQFTFFDLRQRWTDSRNAYNLYNTVVSFCEPSATLGVFSIRTGHLRHLLDRLLGEAVDLPNADPEFKRHYFVTSKFPDLARAVLTPVVTSVIADTPGHFFIDGQATFVGIYRPMGEISSGGNYRVPIKHLDEFLSGAERIGGAILRAAVRAQGA